jgi:hypothetical protein
MQPVAPDSGFVQLRRTRLAEAIAKMATAIDLGECVPTLEELKAVVQTCDEQQLPAEASRVRRWMGLR